MPPTGPGAMIMREVTIVQLARLGDLAQTWPLVAELQRRCGRDGVALVVEERLTDFAGLMVGDGNVLGLPTRKLLGLNAAGKGGWGVAATLAARLKKFAARRVIALNYHEGAGAIAEAIPARQRDGVRWKDVVRGVPSDSVTEQIFAATTGRRRGFRHLCDLWREYAGDGMNADFRAIPLSSEANESALRLLGSAGISAGESPIAIIPGAGMKARAWPTQNFRILLSALPENEPVVMIGAESDVEVAQEIISGSGTGRVSLCGRTDPATLAGVLARCRLAIGTDTGALQVAAMVGCPCLGIYYGSMNFRETGPYGEGHLAIVPDDPLYPYQEWEMERDAGRHASAVPPEAVIEVARAMLDGRAPRPEYPGTRIFHSSLSGEGIVWKKNEKSSIKNQVSRDKALAAAT